MKMNSEKKFDRKFASILAIVIGFIMFIAIAIVTNLFSSDDLPIQISGALLEAVVTALITYFLLTGQTNQEEIKERNVKVFEEKSKRYNEFIDKLWEIWQDREISLEELNELMKIVSKDILPYTKPETINKILIHLNKIADFSNNSIEMSNKPDATQIIQENVFNIINELAKEMGLGGQIDSQIRENLNILEAKVVPFLIQKEFKEIYIRNVIETLENSEDVDFSKIEYLNKYLWCRVKESNVYFRIGPLERPLNQGVLIGIYVEFWNNRNFTKFRDAAKGWRKDFLRAARFMYGNPGDIINFADLEKVKELFYKFKSNKSEDKPENDLAKKIIRHYKEWNFEGKNIEHVIEECTVKQQGEG